jgi:alcohol dehydrogenase class IV
MSFGQLLGVVSAMATILGVFLTIHGVINNRTLKQEFRTTREILGKIDQGQQEARKETAEAIGKMDRGQQEARKEMAEAIRYLADLIRAEGERTRQAVRSPS